VLFIAPFIALILMDQLKFSLKATVIYLYVIIIIAYLLSFRHGFFLMNNLLSFYYILPLIIMIFCKPKGKDCDGLLQMLIYYLTIFTFISNIVGFIQYIRMPHDDSFSGFYGHFTVTQNGLSIINSVLFFYYFKHFQIYKRYVSLLLSGFFLVSTLMGFYGGGLIALLAALVLSFITFSLDKLVSLFVKLVAIFVLLYFLIGYISPRTLQYNKNIISRFWNQEKETMPRKLIAHYYYLTAYPSNVVDFLFGSGPGTYNSRSAFVVSSPEYFAEARIIKSQSQPFYFKNYAYSLWNARNTVQYQDGFMNQPFSSILTFLGEYGLVFTIAFLIFYYRQYLYVLNHPVVNPADQFLKDVYKFVSIFLILLFFLDNYAEYPEITILLILILKLAEGSLYLSKFTIDGK